MNHDEHRPLTVRSAEPLPLAVQPQPNPIAAMLEKVLDKGITAESATAMERLVDLYQRVEAENAKRAFAEAKRQLQAELPKVLANKVIPNKDGTVRTKYADYEQIMDIVGDYLVNHGFSVSFNIRVEPGTPQRLTAICRLTHIAGHSEENEFSVRIGQGPPGCSEAQADGAARSYARRGALCDALNIVIDKDTDARIEGGYITPEQAESLRRRVRATYSDERRFLKFAGDAKSFEAIRDGHYAKCDDALRIREMEIAKEAAQPSPPDDDLDAQDKQRFVDDIRARSKQAKTAAEIADLVAEVDQRVDWIGIEAATRLKDEARTR